MCDQHNGKVILPNHYSPVFLEYNLMKEFVHLQQESPTGVYVVPSHSSPFLWFAVLFVDRGVYSGAVIRFTIQIPFDYPNCGPPIISFDPIVFHPLINPKNGELLTKYNFLDWKCHEKHICELVLFVKTMFVDMEGVLKQRFFQEDSKDLATQFYFDSVRLYNNDFLQFKNKVTESLDECKRKLYETHSEDQNAINFGPWNPEIHEEMRRKLVSGQNITEITEHRTHSNACASGLSWVKKGSSQIFSKFNS